MKKNSEYFHYLTLKNDNIFYLVPKTGTRSIIEKLREQLKIDEGCVYSVYLDHLNLPTVGIGHLVTEWDEEYEKPVGTEVSEDRVNELFEKDVQVTIDECKVLFDSVKRTN